MTILRDISLLWCLIHVIFLFLVLFRSKYTKKKTIILALVIMAVLVIINMGGLAVLGIDIMGKLILFTCSVPSFFAFYLLSEDKSFRYLFTFCLADTVALWVLGVTNLLDYWIGRNQYILMFVLRIIAFPLLEYLAYRYLRKPYRELQESVEKGWGIFSGLILTYYVLFLVMFNFPAPITERPEYMPACALFLILMFFSFGVIFVSMYGQLKLYRKQENERVLQEQMNTLESRLENQEHIRKMKHDMKAHTVTLSGLLAAGKSEEAMQYLQKLETSIDGSHRVVCANPYLNAVFTHYLQKFEDMGMRLELDIRTGDNEIPHMELCRIFSNALENAYEGVQAVEEGKRFVSFHMKNSRDYLIIRIRNSCREDLYVEKGTLPESSKGKKGHGYGLRSIQEITELIDGDMLCYTEDGCFILDIVVRLTI